MITSCFVEIFLPCFAALCDTYRLSRPHAFTFASSLEPTNGCASSLEGAAGLRSSVENLKNELERAESSPAAAGTKVLCAVGDTVEEGRNESELVLEGAPELSKTEVR